MFISDCGNILAHITSNESIYTTTLQLNIYHGLIQQSWSQIRIPPCKIQWLSKKSVPLGGSTEHDSQDNEKTQYSHFINNFTTQLRLQPNVMVQMPFDRRKNSYLGKWLNHKQNWTTKVFCWIVDCISVQGMQQVRAFQLQLIFVFFLKIIITKASYTTYSVKMQVTPTPHPLPKDESWNLQLKTNAFITRTSDRFRHLCRAINQA